MNIDFHYYAVKTIALASGFSEEDAQTIATFSEYVDDYNPGDVGRYNTIPQEIIDKQNSKLILTEEEKREYITAKLMREYNAKHGTYKMPSKQKVDKYFEENGSIVPNFRRISTGFSLSECAKEFCQKTSVAPFHFIAHDSEAANTKEGRFTKPAIIGDDSLISKYLENAKKEYLSSNSTTKKRALMHIGMLLHIFADTYAHAEFSGFNEDCNIAEVSDVKYTKDGSEVPTTDKYIVDYIMQQSGVYGVTKRISAAGHQMVGHLPDYPGVSFTFKFEKPERLVERNNTLIFTEVSMRIFDFLYDIRHEKEGKDSNAAIAQIRQVGAKDTYKYDETNLESIPEGRRNFVKKLITAFSSTPISTFEESWLVTKVVKSVWGKIFGGSDKSPITILKEIWAQVLNIPAESYQYDPSDVFALDDKNIKDENFYYYNSYAEDILMGLYPEDYIQ
ncbi:MAG: hypothetical protein LBM93_07845 [Oscillospiraceae bacterium]|jgi:hypothetical protein|nr:hypothetical protein [Oscillospiraceae bacterium]